MTAGDLNSGPRDRKHLDLLASHLPSSAHQGLNPSSITNLLSLKLSMPSRTKSSKNTYLHRVAGVSLLCVQAQSRACSLTAAHTVHVWPSGDSLRCLPSPSTQHLYPPHSWPGSFQRHSVSHLISGTLGLQILATLCLALGEF